MQWLGAAETMASREAAGDWGSQGGGAVCSEEPLQVGGGGEVLLAGTPSEASLLFSVTWITLSNQQ